MSQLTIAEGLLMGAGNPLLDMSTVVPHSVFEKYELKAGNAILAEEKHQPLYEELVKDYASTLEYIAGGATQNSIRACQWMLGGQNGPKATGYIGGVGNDETAQKLRDAAASAGLTVNYYVDPETPTGRCAVCIEGKERSLVADLGAANKYNKEKHFDTPEIQAMVEKAKFFYSAGFFLTSSPQTLLAIGAHAASHADKRFMLNLAAPFLMQVPFFWESMKQALTFADIVFCNESEAETLGQVTGWGNFGKDLMAVAVELQKSEKKNTDRERLVIFTQGKDPTIVCDHNGPHMIEVPAVDPSKIVDTNGAGDSFVGGFLSFYITGESVENSVKAGNYCASECIQQSGCTFPAQVNLPASVKREH